MGQNNFHSDIELSGTPDVPPWPGGAPLLSRLYARFLTGRLDRDVEAGLLAEPGSALALHMSRLTSLEERECLARSLRGVLNEPAHARPGVPLRIPVHPDRVAACHSVIDDITLLLHSPGRCAPAAWPGCGCCSRTAGVRCIATAAAASPPNCAGCSPPCSQVSNTAAPAMRPSTRSVSARSACASGYSGLVTSMRCCSANARKSWAS